MGTGLPGPDRLVLGVSWDVGPATIVSVARKRDSAWVRKILALLIFTCTSAAGARMLNIPEIGPHYKIITFEKNENPQNVMVVYTKLDRECGFQRQGGQPIVDFYWLMDGQKYKPTHALIKDAVRKRLSVTEITDHSFTLKISDLSELGAASKNADFKVKIEKEGVGCRLVTYFKTEDKLLEVKSLYSESKKTFIPPFRKLLAVTVRGTDAQTGTAVAKTFTAR